MGAFAAPVLTAAAGIFQAGQEREEGKAQQAELNRQAEQEKIAAVDREGQRRRRINQILGTTIAQTGARGISFEGSPQAIAAAEIEQAGLAEAGAKVSELSRIAQLKRAGKAAKIRGKIASTGTLLTTAAQTAQQVAQT